MKKLRIFLPILAIAITIGLSAFNDKTLPSISSATEKADPSVLPDKEKSLKAFSTILTVLKSPRCINCHPTADIPRQGDAQRMHPFGVSRGVANIGGAVQKCGTCHHSENNVYSNVPGAPHWSVAPKTMGWFGLPDNEIAKRLLDKTQNGGRTPQDLVEHMSSDSLVLWAWNPGEGRSKPPVELEEWRTVLKEWLDNGAAIPTN
jgi:hypothetical protein